MAEDSVEAISVKTIAAALRRVADEIDKGYYSHAKGMCVGAAAMLDGIVAENRSPTPVILLPHAPNRDPSTGRFAASAARIPVKEV